MYSSHKDLGVVLSNKLTWSDHLTGGVSRYMATDLMDACDHMQQHTKPNCCTDHAWCLGCERVTPAVLNPIDGHSNYGVSKLLLVYILTAISIKPLVTVLS